MRNKVENTPLHIAAGFDSRKICQELPRKGANLSLKNNQGQMPFVYANKTNFFSFDLVPSRQIPKKFTMPSTENNDKHTDCSNPQTPIAIITQSSSNLSGNLSQIPSANLNYTESSPRSSSFSELSSKSN